MQQSKKLPKEEVIKLYKKTPFPVISLPKDKIELLKDLLFNETPSAPTLTDKKIKLSSSFIPDFIYENNKEKFKPRSASTFKPSSNYNKKYNNEEFQKKDNIIQRGPQIPQSQNQNLNKNKSPRKISINSDSYEFYLCRENSISITDSILLEFIPQPKQVNLNKDLSFLVNYVNCDKKENDNSKIIVKGRKISECSDSSGIIFNNFY